MKSLLRLLLCNGILRYKGSCGGRHHGNKAHNALSKENRQSSCTPRLLFSADYEGVLEVLPGNGVKALVRQSSLGRELDAACDASFMDGLATQVADRTLDPDTAVDQVLDRRKASES